MTHYVRETFRVATHATHLPLSQEAAKCFYFVGVISVVGRFPSAKL